MKLGRFPWEHEPENEYIERIRRQIQLTDRFRLWAILFSIGILVAIIWVAHDVMVRIVQMGGNAVNPAWPWLGFSIGIIIGIGFGFMIHNAIQSLFFALGKSRTERLLLRYYDMSCEQHTTEEDNSE